MVQVGNRIIENKRYKSIKPFEEKLFIDENSGVRFNGLYYVVNKCWIETKKEFTDNGKINRRNEMIIVERENYCIDKGDWNFNQSGKNSFLRFFI